jgi:hypothetical protein
MWMEASQPPWSTPKLGETMAKDLLVNQTMSTSHN